MSESTNKNMKTDTNTDLILHRLEKQLDLIKDMCFEDIILYAFDVSDVSVPLSEFGRILIETDVYYAPSKDLSVQERTMQTMVTLIENYESSKTAQRSMASNKRYRLFQLTHEYTLSTIIDLQLLYAHVVLYAYILDCMYHLPFDTTFIFQNNLIEDVSARWNSMLGSMLQSPSSSSSSSSVVIPSILTPIYDTLISRSRVLKYRFDIITSNRFEQTRRNTSLIFDELMARAWKPPRYFAWCLELELQNDICNRWAMVAKQPS